MSAAVVSRTGRTAVLTGPARTAVERRPVPAPGTGEVRVRLEGCGVCASSLPVWEGRPWFDYPLPPGAPGHEGWGVVDEVGDGVDGLAHGQRVTFLSERAFAEYDLARADGIVPLPPELDGRPFPGEALGCAVNAFARSDVAAGDTVAVVGTGFLGGLLIQLAARAGARVIAVSRRPDARWLATALGAEQTASLEEAEDRVNELTDGDLCDRVLEAAGVQETLDVAARLTRARGRLVIAGYHQDGPREVDMQLWNWRGLDVVNAHERDRERYVEGIRRAAEQVAQGLLDLSPLLTHRFGLDEVDVAFGTLRDRPPGFVKALVLT